MDSSFAVAHHLLSMSYLEKQMWTEAARAGGRAVELSGRATFRLCVLGACLAASGRQTEAEAILGELASVSPRRYVSAAETAFVYVALGQLDFAFDWFERALVERAWGLVLLRVDPRVDPLRADPRFADLLRRVGL